MARFSIRGAIEEQCNIESIQNSVSKIPQEEYLHHHIDSLKEMQPLQPDDIPTLLKQESHDFSKSTR